MSSNKTLTLSSFNSTTHSLLPAVQLSACIFITDFSSKLTSVLAKGSYYVNNNEFLRAIDVFSEAINKDPNWAEAWNKRATVFYMMGEYQKSQNPYCLNI